MAFSVTSVLSSIVAATTRTPHAVKLPKDQDRFARRADAATNVPPMFHSKNTRPVSAASLKSSEALEHDTLTRIRDALYRDQQA